jgi:hypothetical protein
MSNIRLDATKASSSWYLSLRYTTCVDQACAHTPIRPRSHSPDARTAEGTRFRHNSLEQTRCMALPCSMPPGSCHHGHIQGGMRAKNRPPAHLHNA